MIKWKLQEKEQEGEIRHKPHVFSTSSSRSKTRETLHQQKDKRMDNKPDVKEERTLFKVYRAEWFTCELPAYIFLLSLFAGKHQGCFKESALSPKKSR